MIPLPLIEKAQKLLEVAAEAGVEAYESLEQIVVEADGARAMVVFNHDTEQWTVAEVEA